MSLILTNDGGNLNINSLSLTNVEQVNLSTYQDSINASGNLNITLPSNSINMCVNNTNLYSAIGSGLNNSVNAVVVDSVGNLYVGGSFTTAGGIAANQIAKWNGSTWSALGSGMNNTVNALAVDSSNNLYAGGNFTTAGGITVNYVAKWNGSTWSGLSVGPDTGANSSINTVFVDSNNNLYIGGGFSAVAGAAASRIAKWNGSSWSALGTGMSNGYVASITADSLNNIYAGGSFVQAGGVNVSNIAKWNGSVWSALTTGVNNAVSALVVDSSNNLFVGGNFGFAGGVAATRIARWNGSAWSALSNGSSNGTNNIVNALVVDSNNNLYVGGNFTTAGGVTVNYIAKWNGSSWSALGSGTVGMNNNVNALELDSSNNLYAGGSFTTAGGVAANDIAKLNLILANSSSINLYVNSKLVYSSLAKNQATNVMVTTNGTAYGSALYT